MSNGKGGTTTTTQKPNGVNQTLTFSDVKNKMLG